MRGGPQTKRESEKHFLEFFLEFPGAGVLQGRRHRGRPFLARWPAGLSLQPQKPSVPPQAGGLDVPWRERLALQALEEDEDAGHGAETKRHRSNGQTVAKSCSEGDAVAKDRKGTGDTTCVEISGNASIVCRPMALFLEKSATRGPKTPLRATL